MKLDIKTNKYVLKLDSYSDYLVWLIATTGFFGSLYFSEVMHLAPCLLCWWQRILMYPMVVIFAVAILRKDRKAAYYGLPLSVIGMFMSFYHSLLQWGVIKESAINCSATSNVSCSTVQVNLLGFINIPFMAFTAFTAITILLCLRAYLLKPKQN
jgi:disulfide bond formation protein DsbB